MMQKAQNTLNEIHEMAKSKGRKFERVVASAGNNTVGELHTNDQMEVNQINPIADFKGVDQVRHSVHIPDSNQHGAGIELRE